MHEQSTLRYSSIYLSYVGFLPPHAGAYEDFFSAVKRDDGGAVAQLLQRGFDPNSRNPEGQTACIWR